MEKGKEYKVFISKEYYQILKFKQEDLPGIAVVNTSLKNFEPKEVFSWHCSIMLNCEDLIENGMPSKKEVEVLNEFGDFLDCKVKGEKIKPNGLFLARITWNETRELIWRVHNPEICNEFLSKLIIENKYPREFNYRIDEDIDWKLAEWHLQERK